MLNAPLLSLAWYVGESNITHAVEAVSQATPVRGSAPTFVAPGSVGIGRRNEELVIRGGKLELRAEGEAFCGPADRPNPRAKVLGTKVYKQFCKFSEIIRPLYGAILVEYSLETPDELRADDRSYAFRNFYIARRALPDRAWRTLEALLGERVFRRDIAAGVYVSMWPNLNPDSKGLPSAEASALSARIGRLFAASLRE
jgi:hypothetical protein